MLEELPFRVGHLYSRKDIYEILAVPKHKRGGNWDTGYNRYQDDWFIFSGIGTPGRTGHAHLNRFVGNDLEWHGKSNSTIIQPSIQSMIYPTGSIYVFTREDNNNPRFIYRGNARMKEIYDTRPVGILWEFSDERDNHPEILAEEVTSSESYIEGSVTKVLVNIYERNPDARLKCIEYHGWACTVCGFDFLQTYGVIGKDYIHVHHITSLSEIGSEYEVDPIRDLRPVCPNCHSMIHRQKPAYTTEELRRLIESQFTPLQS